MNGKRTEKKIRFLNAIMGGASVVALFCGAVQASTVTPNTDAAALAAILINSDSVSLVAGSAKFTGSNLAVGTFADTGSIFPFTNGVVLSSGRVSSLLGSNEEEVLGTNGDADLSALTGGKTFDAAVLEFSFIPASDQISYSYVFGSNEYPEYVGKSYNDVFGFFVNGKNVALIPGTTNPVAINSVNHLRNSEYYFDNQGRVVPVNLDGLVGRDGKMVVVANVTPGQKNTFKIAIADVGDAGYNSAVFLGTGAVKAVPVQTIDTAKPFYTQEDSAATGASINFDGGTLKLTNGFATQAAVFVRQAGGTIDSNGYAGIFSGALGGTGDLLKTGSLGIQFGGASTYTGKLTVKEGFVVANAANMPGTVLLSDASAFVNFNQDVDGTYAGAISGSGYVVKSGGGTLTVNSQMAQTGGVMVAQGTLKLGVDNAIAAAGTLTFTQGQGPSGNDGQGPTTFQGTIDLNGKSLTVAGLKSAQLASGGTAGGTLAINGGTLNINGTGTDTYGGVITGSTGSLTKNGSGSLTLSGNSSFAGTTTVNGGTLAVTGNLSSALTIASGGILRNSGTVGSVTNSGTMAGDANAMSIMRVNGNFTQNASGVLNIKVDAAGGSDKLQVSGTANLGGTLAVLPALGTYQAGTTYNIVSATTLTGTFTEITGAIPGLEIKPVYTTGGLNLVLNKPIDVAAVVAEASQQLVSETGQAQTRTTTRNSVSAVSNRLQNVFSGRALGGGNQRTAAADTMTGMSAGDENPLDGVSVWADASASRLINSVTDDKFAGWSQNLLFGADKQFTPDWVAGAVVGIEHSDLDTSLLNGRRQALGGSLTGYAGYRINEHSNINVQAGAGALSNKLEQNALGLSGKDTFASWRIMTAVNLNSSWAVKKYELSTLAGLSYAYDSYDDYNASTGRLVSPTPSRLAQIRIGGEAAYNASEKFQPYLSATYEGDISSSGEGARNGAIFGGGARFFISERLTGAVLANAQAFRKNDHVYSAFANIRYSF